MKAKWHTGQVIDLKHISKSKMEFSIAVVHDEIFEFDPGQFITMDLPIGDKRRQRWRSYSIANIPNDKNILSFGIGHLEDGLASSYFFEELKIGDSIKFKGPDGAFVLPKNLEQPIIMIATGTGVVPFVSMLRKIVKDQLPFKKIHLIYGCRFAEDLLYREELEMMEQELSSFDLDFVLSKPDTWEGHAGYVHDVYKSVYKTKSEENLYLLCGWSAMIDEAMANLFPQVATPARQIKYELYG